MRKVANFCDYFVLCSGNSDRHVKAIIEGIKENVEHLGIHIPRAEGGKDARWMLLDLGDVIVHAFEKQSREFYGLEYLWQSAKAVNWKK